MPAKEFSKTMLHEDGECAYGLNCSMPAGYEGQHWRAQETFTLPSRGDWTTRHDLTSLEPPRQPLLCPAAPLPSPIIQPMFPSWFPNIEKDPE